MKYKTLFRVVLKLIGVYLVAMALASAATHAMNLIARHGRMGPVGSWPVLVWFPLAGSAVKAAIGLYLFFGGRWIINLAIPGNRPYCPECGYDLSGSPGGRCPECGTAVPSDDVLSVRTGLETSKRSTESNG